MTNWDYRVPKLTGSRWYREGESRTVYDPDWPLIGVFCDARSHDLWLLGSFTVSARVTTELRQSSWAWQTRYPTGDGFLLQLARHAASVDGGTQYLVDDEVYDRDADQRKLEALADSGDFEKMQALGDQIARKDAAVRARTAIKCKSCGDRVVTNPASVQAPLLQKWRSGVRELSITEFRRALTQR